MTNLKACLGVLTALLILGLREYSWKYYTTFAGVLPEKWYSASGSTPVLNKHGPVPLLREHSHKSTSGSTPKQTICNLDILLPLNTLGVLSVLLFWFLGVLPIGLFFVSGSICYTCYNISLSGYSQKPKIKVMTGPLHTIEVPNSGAAGRTQVFCHKLHTSSFKTSQKQDFHVQV